VVRVSGPLAPEILGKMFQGSFVGANLVFARNGIHDGRTDPDGHRQGSPLQDFDSHRLYYGKILSPSGALLDQGLAVWMKAPRSFTGEEVVELHLHGGPLIARKVLEAIFELGARPAKAGEFTERAFLNGKMDLTQAEAVADMIAAKSERALRLAQSQWQGELSAPVGRLRASLLDLLVNLEAAVDFPEEDIEIIDRDGAGKLLQDSIRQIEAWISDYETGRLIREGLSVVLLGKPNVGKSSLLNRLAKEEAAIVHSEPGTTRDAIERAFQLGGLTLKVVDTAGIREARGEVERVGIERSKRWFEKADLVLALFDSSAPFTEEDRQVAGLASTKRAFFILNKADLPPAWDPSPLLSFYIKDGMGQVLSLSAKTGAGIQDLEEALPSFFGLNALEKSDHLLLNQLRHKKALQDARASLERAQEGLRKRLSPDLIAAELMAGSHHLGEIIGELNTDQILEEIFSRFCIGK